MDVLITQQVRLSQQETRRVFDSILEDLTEGWYIALSAGPNKTKWVLCHDDPPHPHNGSTVREQELDLETEGYQVIRRACELQEALKLEKKT